MAIATLAECYNNINVFRGVVKIRRGGDLNIYFILFALKIQHSWLIVRKAEYKLETLATLLNLPKLNFFRDRNNGQNYAD